MFRANRTRNGCVTEDLIEVKLSSKRERTGNAVGIATSKSLKNSRLFETKLRNVYDSGRARTTGCFYLPGNVVTSTFTSSFRYIPGIGKALVNSLAKCTHFDNVLLHTFDSRPSRLPLECRRCGECPSASSVRSGVRHYYRKDEKQKFNLHILLSLVVAIETRYMVNYVFSNAMMRLDRLRSPHL